MYGTFYRHLLLPLFDRVIKGRDTLALWAAAEKSQWWTREQHEATQLVAVQNLLRHAWESCPYYRGEWQQLGLDPRHVHSLADLQQWPLIRRETIRAHRAAMRSTRPLRLMSKATGGSSGEPLQFDLDTGSNDRRVAMTFRGYHWAKGEPGTKQLYIWGGPLSFVPSLKRWKQSLHARIENRKIINCFEFSEKQMRRHFKTYQRYRPQVIVAYTNQVYEFARFVEEHQLVPTPPQSIIVGAEKLYDFQRTLIERVFQTKVFETYGSREFMLIGSECDRHEGLHLSMENLLVEILDDDGHPTPAGEEGNIVITDLFNYGMPFIRYVNGDRALAGSPMCSCGRGLPLLKQVTGRRMDTLHIPGGRMVPGAFFPHLMKEFPDVRRFQVVQQIPEIITLKLVAPQLREPEQRRLLDAVHACTGLEVKVDLQFVNEIPLTQAGKQKIVISHVTTSVPDAPSVQGTRADSPGGD